MYAQLPKGRLSNTEYYHAVQKVINELGTSVLKNINYDRFKK